MTKPYICLIGFIALSGCGTWPDYGNGGMDEVYKYERSENLDPSHSAEDRSKYLISKNLDAAREKIDLGWRSDAGKYRPYDLTLIDIQWGRTAREFAGHLHQDAEASLEKLKNMLRKLDADLETLKPIKTIASARGI